MRMYVLVMQESMIVFCNNNDDDEILSKLKLIFSKYKKKRICNRSKIYRGPFLTVIFAKNSKRLENYITVNFYKGKSTSEITSGI